MSTIPDTYLRSEKIIGIGKITNLVSSKVYLYSSLDIVSSFTEQRFLLDMSLHDCKSLQEDYTSIGLELFSLSLDYEVKDPLFLDSSLKKREEYYINKGIELYKN